MRSNPYKGAKETLVIALDIGTTYSGSSFCILTPGEEPKLNTVTKYDSHRVAMHSLTSLRYPGLEHIAGSAKIPTQMCYDGRGSMLCAGAEIEERLENDGITEPVYSCQWYGNSGYRA
jgi:hypothetical protein